MESGIITLSTDEWTLTTSNANGFIGVRSDFSAADGQNALVMGQTVSGVNVRNEATWRVDLSGVTAAVLQFYHLDIGDEEQQLPVSFTGSFNGDGVSISQDGVTWYRVLNATNIPANQWKLESIDLVVTPGLGFDAQGRRLGRGMAFYDGFFAQPEVRALRCGIGFFEQMVDHIPVTEHDKTIHVLVTDQQVVWPNR